MVWTKIWNGGRTKLYYDTEWLVILIAEKNEPFGTKHDFPPEEKTQLKRKNAWLIWKSM